ncbi:MAG: YdiU family protein [Pseudomonadota bacterium]
MTPPFSFDNSYAERLEGFYVDWEAAKAPAPELLALNRPLANELGIDLSSLGDSAIANLFSGNEIPEGAHPLAQVYAGHQFGGFSPQLGDGRALLLGEVIDCHGLRKDIQLKGSGSTPFSRGGDGKAAIGPVLREYLVAEAMHALGVPTTRALAAVKTGEQVWRELPLPGAILTRVAASHVRVGTFQFFASRGESDKVQQLVDYVVWRHYPACANHESPALGLLEAVCEQQAKLVAHWMTLGFIHGVMNTDNMTLSGETIDYGPCAFMDHYDRSTVFSSIDEQGRYAYGNQPALAQWNLARFAECLIELIDSNPERAVALATDVINAFPGQYERHWLSLMRNKLGLADEVAGDLELADDFLKTMEGQKVDFTLAFRHLADVLRGDEQRLRGLYEATTLLDPWLVRWKERIKSTGVNAGAVVAAMDRSNPLYIPRNHKVEEALSAAEKGDLALFRELHAVLQSPFSEREGLSSYAESDPEKGAGFKTFCGT